MNTRLPDGGATDRIPPNDPEVRPWMDVVDAARRERSLAPREKEAAPFGFATRIASDWMARCRDENALRWQRWSFRAAAFSVVLAVFAVLAARPFRDLRSKDGAILPYPGLEVPLPLTNDKAL